VTRVAALFAVVLLAQTVDPGPAVWRLALKDGRVYSLQSPPRDRGERLEFTTASGYVYSVNKREISNSAPVPTPRATPIVYDPLDERNLGAIARQQRGRETVPVSPGPAPRARARRPTARPTPVPTPRPTYASPASGAR
jgi:hypothetical protein